MAIFLTPLVSPLSLSDSVRIRLVFCWQCRSWNEIERNRCEVVGISCFSMLLFSELLLFPTEIIDVPDANKSSLCKKLSVLVFLVTSNDGEAAIEEEDDAMLLDCFCCCSCCCRIRIFPVGHALNSIIGLTNDTFLSSSLGSTLPPVVPSCDDDVCWCIVVVMDENDDDDVEELFSLTDCVNDDSWFFRIDVKLLRRFVFADKSSSCILFTVCR